MAEESGRTEALARQNSDLQDQIAKTTTSPKDNGSRRSLQKQLEEATQKLAGQKEVADQLAREKAALAARLGSLEADTANTTALRAENDMLRSQIANLNNTLQQANNTNELGRRLVAAEAQIAALQSERSLLHLERAGLENRVNKLLAAATLAPTRAEDARRIKALEQDRDALQRQLATANKQLATNKDKPASGLKADELAAQLAAVRAKLDVYETKLVPYSPEELALFRQPVKLATTDQPARKSNSIPKPPAGARDLVIEAQRLFARGDFAEAELKYLELLKKDEKNLYTLANLAAIQIEQGKLDDAEKNLKQAITVAPEDAYSMQMLGYLKFRQQKYNDALTALSQAARLNPDSAEVQNYLGVTLSNIGQRDAAERALRNALRLEPNYGSAHNNLAVIYATQEPPSVELARWHYQRALDAGNPKHPELEKLFEKKAAIAQ
jgi:tetratricopeptide (TPR) repeat protein